jgi:hypothetical protein
VHVSVNGVRFCFDCAGVTTIDVDSFGISQAWQEIRHEMDELHEVVNTLTRHNAQLASERDEACDGHARLMAWALPAMEILEGLRASVEWELAPFVMRQIEDVTDKGRAWVAALARRR